MRSQIPAYGVGRFVETRGASFPVKAPKENRTTMVRMEYRRKRLPFAAAPNPIVNIMSRTVMTAKTMCMVSVSVPPPAARTSRWCIGGQKKPVIPWIKINTPAMCNGRFRPADFNTPHPKAVNNRAYHMTSEIQSCLVEAPMADSSLTVCEAVLYPLYCIGT